MTLIIGFCNPLLDISISNHPEIKRLLLKYELKDNDIILADPNGKHSELIEDMKSLGTLEYSAGGAGLNSLRCAQLLLEKESCRIVGSIGNDFHAQILINKSLEIGLLTDFQMDSPKPTGKCACLIHGPFRSLVAYLDAAKDFHVDHLNSLRDQIKSAEYLYITGFFYSVSPLSVKRILSFAPAGRIIFNLSATFVADMMNEDDFDSIMKSVYILIGNSDEFDHLKRRIKGEQVSLKCFVDGLIEKYSNSLIMITQGSDPIILLKSGEETLTIPVPPVEKVVDTNGAGDAFVGGILGGLSRNLSLIESIRIGCFMAGKIISEKGINPPSRDEIETLMK